MSPLKSEAMNTGMQPGMGGGGQEEPMPPLVVAPQQYLVSP
jgi:hypothetical protein